MHTGRLKFIHNIIQNSYIFQRTDLAFLLLANGARARKRVAILYTMYDLQSFMCICWLL